MGKKIFKTIIFLFLITLGQLYAKNNNTKVTFIYFHGPSRCSGCLKLEENIVKSLESLYSDEIKNKSYEYKSLDFLAEENVILSEKYNIETQTLIISKVVNDTELKWVNLEKIWDNAGNFHKMKKYIDREMKKFINSR